MARKQFLDGYDMSKGLPMSEAELQSAVIEMAQLFGWLCHHGRASQSKSGRWSTAVQGDVGFPDLVLARAGEVLFIELKSANNRLTQPQECWQAALGALVWRPEQLRDGTIQKRLRRGGDDG
jgi:hypothetical protein